jgi:hypothetical protein
MKTIRIAILLTTAIGLTTWGCDSGETSDGKAGTTTATVSSGKPAESAKGNTSTADAKSTKDKAVPPADAGKTDPASSTEPKSATSEPAKPNSAKK